MLAALILLGGPFFFPGADLYCLVFGLACFYASLALAWNILALSGLLSLGHGAFFGLGAYAAILLEQYLASADLSCGSGRWPGGRPLRRYSGGSPSKN